MPRFVRYEDLAAGGRIADGQFVFRIAELPVYPVFLYRRREARLDEQTVEAWLYSQQAFRHHGPVPCGRTGKPAVLALARPGGILAGNHLAIDIRFDLMEFLVLYEGRGNLPVMLPGVLIPSGEYFSPDYPRIVVASMEGWSTEGGMIYEYDPATGQKDADRHWWVQAETVVGCVDQYQLTGDPEWLEKAAAQWRFIRENLICPDGEWYWSMKEDGSPNLTDDRAGFWKCPYHNGRMCLEMLTRL